MIVWSYYGNVIFDIRFEIAGLCFKCILLKKYLEYRVFFLKSCVFENIFVLFSLYGVYLIVM